MHETILWYRVKKLYQLSWWVEASCYRASIFPPLYLSPLRGRELSPLPEGEGLRGRERVAVQSENFVLPKRSINQTKVDDAQ
jgi:hypothetical protein